MQIPPWESSSGIQFTANKVKSLICAINIKKRKKVCKNVQNIFEWREEKYRWLMLLELINDSRDFWSKGNEKERIFDAVFICNENKVINGWFNEVNEKLFIFEIWKVK